MGIQTMTVWYSHTWWIGTKEVLILLGFLVAAFTYRRNTFVRAQDVQASQIQRTFDLMQRYPGATRELVLKVTQQLKSANQIVTKLEAQKVDQRELEQVRAQWLEKVELITLLHHLDPWGFLLSYPEHLLRDEAMNTFASEVNRVLLDERLIVEIDQILKTSSMNGVPELIQLLKKYQVKSKE